MKKSDFSALTDKFNPMDIEWRVQSAGETNKKIWARVLAYVDARAVQERLDAVCGPENWKDDYQILDKGILCRLSIKVDGEWITKSNGAPETDIEGFKGGISKALVRAASTWGIGRYLYNLEATFANIVEKNIDGARSGHFQAKNSKDRIWFNWTPPSLPKWALPETKTEVPPVEPKKPKAKDTLSEILEVVSVKRIPPEYMKALIKNMTGSQKRVAELQPNDLTKILLHLESIK